MSRPNGEAQTLRTAVNFKQQKSNLKIYSIVM